MSTPTSHDSVLCTNLDSSGRSIECMDPQIVEIEGDLTSGIDSMALTTAGPGNMACLASICTSADPKGAEAPVALSPPACRLPFDVLESIFLACIDDFNPSITNPRHPSVTLSRVCTSWRSTALQCNALWATLRIYFPRPAHRQGEGYTPLWHQSMAKFEKALEVWVDRLGASPMTMVVTSGPVSAYMPVLTETNEAHLTLIHAIKRSSIRWSKFVLNIAVGPDCEALLQLMQLTSASVPLLETISLEVSSLSRMWESTLHHKVKGVLSTSGIFLSPSLRSVTLNGHWDVTASTAVHLWPPLTHLDVSCVCSVGVPSVFGLFRYLEAIPTLVDVSTSIQGHEVNTSPKTLKLPNLKRLTIVGACIPQGLGPILNLPALQDLHLRVGDARHSDAGSVEFILQFGAQLNALTFCPDFVQPQSLSKIFENLPGVETLKMEAHRSESSAVYSEAEPGVDFNVITELNAFSTSAVRVVNGVVEGELMRCPRLRRLELSLSSDTYSDWAVEMAFVRFLRTRSLRRTPSRIGKCRLQHVSIVLRRGRRFWTDVILDAIKKMGVHPNICITRVDMSGVERELCMWVST